ncbi:hypothetical protein [Kitasatospora terrestris]|uniref:Uncharacterized protein n=1 Tax=Kitasatospora terrestris TaxID=258051 RepID=A0ABP9DBT1_9ACTN
MSRFAITEDGALAASHDHHHDDSETASIHSGTDPVLGCPGLSCILACAAIEDGQADGRPSLHTARASAAGSADSPTTSTCRWDAEHTWFSRGTPQAVVSVAAGQRAGERDTVRVGAQAMLAALPAPITRAHRRALVSLQGSDV